MPQHRTGQDHDGLLDSSKDDAEWFAAQSATDGYTGEPCVQCRRIRVFLRNDGQRQCEKCETFQPDEAPPA